jgi:superfamily II DNA or RNA helicase
MNIKIKVGPTTSHILRASPMLLTKLSDLCSYQKVSDRAKKYSKACQNGWDGRVTLFNKFNGSLPTGLVPKIVRWLKDEGYEVELEKALPQTSESGKLQNIHPMSTLRPYQVEAIERMIRNKRGILQLPTGAGKTETAVGAVGVLKRSTIFFVHTKELVAQTKERFQRYYPAIKIGTIGDGVIDPGPITIASIQTVSSWLMAPKEPQHKPKETSTEFQARFAEYEQKLQDWMVLNERALTFLAKFPVAIFDECHHLAAETFFICAQACTGAEYLFAMSATPWRDDNADLLIEAGSGKVIYALSLSDVVEMGYLLPAEIHIHDYQPLPPMDLSDVYAEQYKICITENEGRNEKIAEVAAMEHAQGHSILILCRELAHIDRLSKGLHGKGIPHDTVHARKKDRDRVLERFRQGQCRVLIGSTIFDEGVDIPAVDVVVMAGAGRSRVKAYQRIGRALRPYPGKTKAIIHDFRDTVKPFYYHFLDRMKIYKAERAFTVHDHRVERKREVIRKKVATSKILEGFSFG